MKYINLSTKVNLGIVLIATSLFTTTLYSQQGRVGINTQSPTSTLDVRGKSDVTDVTGFQAPRLTRLELTTKGDNLYGLDQKGAIIFITDVTNGNSTGQRINMNDPGYYFFDGVLWQELTFGGWKLSGNKNTNPENNFLGTLDNTKLVFKVNNLSAGVVEPMYMNSNTALGGSTFISTPNTNDVMANTAIGAGGLSFLKKGLNNAAIGAGSMYSSALNVNENTAIGSRSLTFANNANKNTAVGSSSGMNLLAGSNNLAIGADTSFPDPQGSYQINIANSIFGTNSGFNLETSYSLIGINLNRPKSSLDVKGTFAYSIGGIDESMDQNNVNAVYNSASTFITKIPITLPQATNSPNRIYNIVYGGGTVIITNELIDAGISVFNYVLNNTPGSKRVTVQSYNGKWYIISSS